jgi:hypothetical protein
MRDTVAVPVSLGASSAYRARFVACSGCGKDGSTAATLLHVPGFPHPLTLDLSNPACIAALTTQQPLVSNQNPNLGRVDGSPDHAISMQSPSVTHPSIHSLFDSHLEWDRVFSPFPFRRRGISASRSRLILRQHLKHANTRSRGPRSELQRGSPVIAEGENRRWEGPEFEMDLIFSARLS